MNTPKFDCQERIQQFNGLITDCAYRQNCAMVIRAHPPPVMEAGSQQQALGPEKSSSSMVSRFESPASAFYATERYMRFPQYDSQVGSTISSQYSKSYDSQFPSYHPYWENSSVGSREQADLSFGLRSNPQTVGKPRFSNALDYTYKDLCSSSAGNRLHLHEQNKLFDGKLESVGNHFSVPFQGNRNRLLGFPSQQEKQSLRFSSGSVSASSGNSVSSVATLSSKTRIRWTQDLHEKFVECVNRLGGAERATPKAILKLMDSDGLTIFHVKSHLQKYRIAKYMPDPSEGKAEKRSGTTDASLLDVKTSGLQIKEALQLQLDVQRRLHEQLEIQRNLQMRIEEQGRQLRMMFAQQQRACTSLQNNQNMEIASSDAPTFTLEDIDHSVAGGSNREHRKKGGTNSGLQSLQLQLEIHMPLHEQLVVQRNLQLRIEELERQIRLLFDQQQRATVMDMVSPVPAARSSNTR